MESYYLSLFFSQPVKSFSLLKRHRESCCKTTLSDSKTHPLRLENIKNIKNVIFLKGKIAKIFPPNAALIVYEFSFIDFQTSSRKEDLVARVKTLQNMIVNRVQSFLVPKRDLRKNFEILKRKCKYNKSHFYAHQLNISPLPSQPNRYIISSLQTPNTKSQTNHYEVTKQMAEVSISIVINKSQILQIQFQLK